MSRMAPPEPDTARTHALLSLTYIGPALAMVAFAPQGSAVAITAAFAGPLTAVWMVDRRQIALHLTAASIALFLPSLLGLVDRATFVTCLYLAPIMWALAATCVIVLEAAERQGAELVRLGRRDPSPALATAASSTRSSRPNSNATRAPARRSRSSPSISTASRPSTTPSAMPLATGSCRPPPRC